MLGLTPEQVLEAYAPSDGAPGIEMACFNLAEGRFRQNNLHYVRPLRLGHRHYIQDMYENRYQKQWGSILRFAWGILRHEFKNLWVLPYYLLIHIAGLLDRRGRRGASDWIRRRVSLRTVELGIGSLLDTRFRTILTHLGGAAVDVDNNEDLVVVEKMAEFWKTRQARQARLARAS